MKRIVFFAHYDRDNIVDEYVLYYLKGLKNIADQIIFASDSNLSQKELKKLDKLALVAHSKSHGEYDFGSWKRCLKKYQEKLCEYDELVLANDSCFAPFHPFKPVFQKMALKNCDAWSLTQTKSSGEWHLNSYFMVLKPSVFLSKKFRIFFENIRRKNTKKDIIEQCELGFSRMLLEKEFVTKSYIPHVYEDAVFSKKEAFRLIQEEKLPTLKTSLLKINFFQVDHIKDRFNLLHNSKLKSIIYKYLMRMHKGKEPNHWFLPFSAYRIRLGPFFSLKGKYKYESRWYRLTIRILFLPVIIYIPNFMLWTKK